MVVWIFFNLFALILADLHGAGTTISALPSWISSYQQITPFQLNYNMTGAPLAIREMIHQTVPYIDFAFTAAIFPNTSDRAIDPNIQLFPIVCSTVVPQVNIPIPNDVALDLVFSREVMAAIFMGNITYWRDPQILQTNQDIEPYLPDANITVVYRSDISGDVKHMTSVFSVFSSEWGTQYGAVASWPSPLRNLPNFISGNSNLDVHATVIMTPNSIGYVALGSISRDPSIRFACLYDQWGQVVCPTDDSMTAAVNDIKIDLSAPVTTSIYIDGPTHGAWTSAIFVQTLVHTQFLPERCEEIRDLFKFFHWTLTDQSARAQTAGTGLIPVPSPIVDATLAQLNKIQCDGNSVLALTSNDFRDIGHEVLIILNSLFLAFVVLLSVIHFYLFRTSTINTVYSIIFLIGSGINLSAPYAWNMTPSTNSVCLGRAWLTSLGLSLLLGSLFARTWQLRDIYYLQKKTTVENLQTQITVRSSLIKLALTIMSVLIIQLVILTMWTLLDPYTATLKPVDNELNGMWTCVSVHLSIWMFLEVILLAFLIFFGVYVIYRTWSFQRASVVRETRWVLMVLYNIVLNVVAAFPVAVVTHANDEILSLVVIASLMFSGGGIVLSFLLPRILRYFRHKRQEKKDSRSREDERRSSAETPTGAKLRVRIRDHSQDPIQTHPETTATRGTSLSGYHSSSSLIAPATPTYSPNMPSYSPNMTAINEERAEGSAMREIELITTKSGKLTLNTKVGRGELVISESHTNNNSDEEEEDSKKPDGSISLSPSRNLLITTEEQHLLEVSERGPEHSGRAPSPAPVSLLWSSNPLAGTEHSTPMEEDITPMQ